MCVCVYVCFCVCVCERERERERERGVFWQTLFPLTFLGNLSLTEKGIDLLHKIPMQSLSYAYCRWYVSRKGVCWQSVSTDIPWRKFSFRKRSMLILPFFLTLLCNPGLIQTALEPCQSSLRMDEGLRVFDVIAQSFYDLTTSEVSYSK